MAQNTLQSTPPAFRFWRKWLMTANLLLACMGVELVFLSDSILFAPLHDPINEHFFGTAQLAPDIAKFSIFVFAIIGGLTAGFAWLSFQITRHALRPGATWVWNSLMTSVIAWFVLDTGMSAYLGVHVNVVGNAAFFLLIAVPLLAIRKHIFVDTEHLTERSMAAT